MKYIITDKNEIGIGENTYHQSIYQNFNFEGKVVRAGHCEKVGSRYKVWGSSIGYNINSKQEDADILNKSKDIKVLKRQPSF